MSRKGRINLSSANKEKAKLNNHLFFNYNNQIEENVRFQKRNSNILEIVMSDKNCTAKFGNMPNQTMNIHSIKIVKKLNFYEKNTHDGEIILTYKPLKDSITEYGQVCIKLKEVNDPEDARINDFFKPMLVKGSDGYSNTRKSDGEKFKINLDHLIPNGSPFYYAKVNDGTVLDDLSPGQASVILFDDYSSVYCPSGILNSLTSITSNKVSLSINDRNLTINNSGAVNEDEEFITECTPIGADVNPEDWSKPAKNTIFSFLTNGKLKSIAMSKILKGELFDFGDYEGDDMIVYVAFHLIILFILCAIVVALANLAGPGMYYKEGVKAGVAQTLGTDK